MKIIFNILILIVLISCGKYQKRLYISKENQYKIDEDDKNNNILD